MSNTATEVRMRLRQWEEKRRAVESEIGGVLLVLLKRELKKMGRYGIFHGLREVEFGAEL